MINKTKRQMIPRSVKIPRKSYFWGATSNPGPHKKDQSVPMLHILRDYLKVGGKEREIARILINKHVKVDGKVVKEKKYPVGFMDLVTVDGMKTSYRILYDKLGRLVPVETTEENNEIKPRKVVDKKTEKGGKTMISFHDGYNFITENKNLETGDVVLFNVKKNSMEGTIKLQSGSKVFLTGGNHVGSFSTIKSVEVSKSSRSNLVSMEEGFATIEEYVFPIGHLKFHTEQAQGGENQ